MVAPVTGPFQTSIATREKFYQQTKYKQKAPRNLVLPYRLRAGKNLTFNYPNSPTQCHCDTPWMESGWSSTVPKAQAVAYAKLLGKISDRANMGENLGQLGPTARLLREKLVLVSQTIRRLRRLDPSVFGLWYKEGISPKMAPRTAARWTLEVNFAIVPTINDIFACVEILQNPVNSSLIKGGAQLPFEWTAPIPGPWTPYRWGYGTVYAQYGAWIAISNPNLYLANAMGLINPAQIAWQLLPGSFLVDWLIPVEQFLGYATDFYGLTVEHSWTTVLVKGTTWERWTVYNWGGSVLFADMTRASGISLPSLAFRPLKVPSLKRAANAASLAILAFGPGRRGNGGALPGFV